MVRVLQGPCCRLGFNLKCNVCPATTCMQSKPAADTGHLLLFVLLPFALFGVGGAGYLIWVAKTMPDRWGWVAMSGLPAAGEWGELGSALNPRSGHLAGTAHLVCHLHPPRLAQCIELPSCPAYGMFFMMPHEMLYAERLFLQAEGPQEDRQPGTQPQGRAQRISHPGRQGPQHITLPTQLRITRQDKDTGSNSCSPCRGEEGAVRVEGRTPCLS
jgi:hypothetical protein